MSKRSAYGAPRGSPSIAVMIAIAAAGHSRSGAAAVDLQSDYAASDSGTGRLGPS